MRGAVDGRLIIFTRNPFDQVLDNHGLRGKLNGCRSINITGDWRIVYRMLDERTAYLLEIGPHSELYSE